MWNKGYFVDVSNEQKLDKSNAMWWRVVHEVLQDNELVDSGKLFPICCIQMLQNINLVGRNVQEAKKQYAAHIFCF